MPLNPEGQLLDEGHCVGSAECSCVHAGQRYPPGASLLQDCHTWYLGLRCVVWEGLRWGADKKRMAGEAGAGATGSVWAEGQEGEEFEMPGWGNQ